ncbi:MAG: beta-lactamase family protein [Actinobacteria bacterium]|nr:beta-lactamase family protein [Actinomycetota bacterium]MBO0786273.1 beta-lactamase family protein [Actinomycetota bacterium]
MNEQELQAKVAQAARELAVPGVAVGVYHQGAEHYACHGVTSVENPLPVDAGTLFQFGSTGKTYTATAIMRLVDRGEVDLAAPVRRYVPGLTLSDEQTAARVTVLQLLNHTAGWAGDLLDNTGTGDDALARYVARMARLEQVTPLGTTVSYNNASLSLAGRLIELVTGNTFEDAMKELLFEPLGLTQSFFFPSDVMTRRFVAGHNQQPDGTITVARPWAMPRGSNPAGGITSNAGDLIRWARFHLGDGRAADGTRVLPAELLRSMQQPTAQSPGNATGDAVGISWWLRDVGGVRVVGHGGNTLGQDSGFDMVPERDFAVITLANCSPNGSQFNEQIRRWAFDAYLGVTERDPELVTLSAAELARYAGRYETLASTADITAADGNLMVAIAIRPEVRAELTDDQDADPDLPPFSIGLLEGPGDRYIVTDGAAKGMKGYFARAGTGEITGIHLGGRLATRTGPVSPAPPA